MFGTVMSGRSRTGTVRLMRTGFWRDSELTILLLFVVCGSVDMCLQRKACRTTLRGIASGVQKDVLEITALDMWNEEWDGQL